MARPPKLTPQITERLCEALRGGNYIDTSCEYAGIAVSTYHRWMNEATEDNASNIKKEFREAVVKARSEAEIRNVTLIQRAATGGTWQAAAWWLERSHPTKWGRQQRITQEISGPNGSPIQVSDPRAALLALIGDDDDDTQPV